MNSKIAGLIAVAVALLCCALPLLIAAGVLGGLAAWLTSGLLLAVAIGTVMLAAVLFALWHRFRKRRS